MQGLKKELNRKQLTEYAKIYKSVYLKPGEVYFSKKKEIVHTVLGSCVSVVIFNKEKKISYIGHAQLPSKNSERKCFADCPVMCLQNLNYLEDFRYVTCSLEFMIKKMINKSEKKNDLSIKIFGAASVLTSNKKSVSVGDQNLTEVYRILKKYKLKIESKDVGKDYGRSIYLFSDLGLVYVANIKQGLFPLKLK